MKQKESSREVMKKKLNNMLDLIFFFIFLTSFLGSIKEEFQFVRSIQCLLNTKHNFSECMDLYICHDLVYRFKACQKKEDKLAIFFLSFELMKQSLKTMNNALQCVYTKHHEKSQEIWFSDKVLLLLQTLSLGGNPSKVSAFFHAFFFFKWLQPFFKK